MTSSQEVLDGIAMAMNAARAMYAGLDTVDLSGMELREYQVEAAVAAGKGNALVVLPTGLGKTMVAVLHVAAAVHGARAGGSHCLVVMVAPTRSLLVQHHAVFSSKLRIDAERVAIVDGSTSPKARGTFYDGVAGWDEGVLFMTPQALNNDLSAGTFPARRVTILVLDEAHHATEDHPYVQLHEGLKRRGARPRVLAMTASPGNRKADTEVLCRTLDIDPGLVVRKGRDDARVQPYIHHVHVRRIGVDLPAAWARARSEVVRSLAGQCSMLVVAGLMDAGTFEDGELQADLPRSFFLDLFKRFGGGNGDPVQRTVLSHVARCVKVQHALEMLETYGIDAFLEYHDTLKAEVAPGGAAGASKATLAVLADAHFNEAVRLALALQAPAPGGDAGTSHPSHPKLAALRESIGGFLQGSPGSRVLVFAKFRASMAMILEALDAIDGVRAARFVGRGTRKRSDKGMTREEQAAVLGKFREGELNVLVATSVAEEGLDIAECDLVVFYESVASLITLVQRMGRTGRARDGHVHLLFARGTTDELRMRVVDARLARMAGMTVYEGLPGPAGGHRASRVENVAAFMEGPAGAGGVPRVSITDLKRAQDANPIAINGACVLAGALAACVTGAGVAAMVSGPSSLPDVMVGKHAAGLVHTIRSACGACVDGSVFGALDRLALGHGKPFVLLVKGGDTGLDGVDGATVVAWLERICKGAGVPFIEAPSVQVAGIIVAGMRENASL